MAGAGAMAQSGFATLAGACQRALGLQNLIAVGALDPVGGIIGASVTRDLVAVKTHGHGMRILPDNLTGFSADAVVPFHASACPK